MSEEIQEEIMNVADEVLRIAAPTNHSHSNATTSKSGYMSSSDKAKLDGIEPNADKTKIIVDASLPDNTESTNPVQAKVIMAKLKEIKNTIINITNTLDPTSTTQAVSGKGIADYVIKKITESEKGSNKSPINASSYESFDKITSNGTYYIADNPTNITCGNETVNVYGGYMEVKTSAKVQTQNIIASNGVEYSRWKNNNSSSWTNWRIYHMPRRQYTKPFVISENVFNIEIMEDTRGYTIIWNQSYSSDRNYFIASAVAGEWKPIVKFQPELQINGCFIFGNSGNTYDIMITSGHYDTENTKTYDSGMYIRTPNGSERIKGINYSFFVPRNN